MEHASMAIWMKPIMNVCTNAGCKNISWHYLWIKTCYSMICLTFQIPSDISPKKTSVSFQTWPEFRRGPRWASHPFLLRPWGRHRRLQSHRMVLRDRRVMEHRHQMKRYPSSHNHGSVENGCISNMSFLSFRVIFHWTMIMGGSVDHPVILWNPSWNFE